MLQNLQELINRYEEFAPIEGQELRLPDDRRHQPHPKFLQEHREMHGFA